MAKIPIAWYRGDSRNEGMSIFTRVLLWFCPELRPSTTYVDSVRQELIHYRDHDRKNVADLTKRLDVLRDDFNNLNGVVFQMRNPDEGKPNLERLVHEGHVIRERFNKFESKVLDALAPLQEWESTSVKQIHGILDWQAATADRLVAIENEPRYDDTPLRQEIEKYIHTFAKAELASRHGSSELCALDDRISELEGQLNEADLPRIKKESSHLSVRFHDLRDLVWKIGASPPATPPKRPVKKKPAPRRKKA